MKIFRVGLYLKYMLRFSRTTQCKQCKLKNYNKSNQSGLDLEILYIFHISFHIFHIVNVLGLDWRRPRYIVGVESFWIVRQLLTNSGLFQLLFSIYSFWISYVFVIFYLFISYFQFVISGLWDSCRPTLACSDNFATISL